MTTHSSRMSLILITRNRRDELETTLRSVAEQEAAFELVVVDNGSDDGTPEMVRQVAPRAVLLELGRNEGVSGGRNRGVEAAGGELLVFLDDDATFAGKDALARIAAHFENDPGLGILAANSWLTATGKPEREAIPRRDKRIVDTDYESSYFCGVGFAVRREVFDRIGLFFEPYVYSCEELDFSWRAVEAGWRIVRAADVVVWHRRTPLERPQGRWVYSNAKNRLWLAARHLPWRYVVSHGAIWWTYLFWSAVRNGLTVDFFRGVRESIGGLPSVLDGRRRLSSTTIAAIREKHGRLVC